MSSSSRRVCVSKCRRPSGCGGAPVDHGCSAFLEDCVVAIQSSRQRLRALGLRPRKSLSQSVLGNLVRGHLFAQPRGQGLLVGSGGLPEVESLTDLGATSLICAGCAAPNGSSLVTPLGKAWIAVWKFVHALEAGSEVSLA